MPEANRRRLFLAVIFLMCLAAVGSAQNPASFDTRAVYLFERLDAGVLPTPMMVAMMRDPFPETRILLLRVVASSADPNQAMLLREFLRDPDFRIRYQVMLAAGRLGPAGRDIALAGLGDQIARVRQAAAWAACHGGDEALEVLIRRMGAEPDLGVRTTVAANLWRFGDADWEPHAIAAAASDSAQLRRAAAYSLARSPRISARPTLRRLAADGHAVIRATAVAGLGQAPPAKDDLMVLARALADPDPRVRAAACGTLTSQPEPELDAKAKERIASMWRSTDPHLAVMALKTAGARPAIGNDENLLELVRTAEPWVASEALAALARRGGEGAAEIASEWLASDEPWRRRAVAAIATHLDSTVEKAAAADERAAVRLAWLEGLDPEQAKTRLEVLRSVLASDPDAAVRTEALDLLGEIGAAGGLDELLALARSWRSDEMPDARATALTTALGTAVEDDQRDRVLELARADDDPAVAVLVTNAARDLGLEAPSPEREPRHNKKWYLDLLEWMPENHWLDIVTDRGTFRIRLDALEAPITTREIFELASVGFYDDLTFHRVVPNFVVQGGDPRGDGWGGPGFTIPDEPAFRPFDRWQVGVATSGPNTGGSQLFITLMPADKLVGHYTNIGEVVAGREVVSRLRVGDRIHRIEAVSGEAPPLPTPVLLGELEWRELAELDPWQAEYDGYQPDPAVLDLLATASGRYRLVTVLGTWCEDSEREVPRLVKLLDVMDTGPFDHRMIGVDRTRRIEDNELAVFSGVEQTVERVSTMVVFDSDGFELGRVVETADKPLEELLVDFLAPVEGW
jgi:cyclophilin family peptidyl-prolyl cis-trans isomerase/HEAT repeat protein